MRNLLLNIALGLTGFLPVVSEADDTPAPKDVTPRDQRLEDRPEAFVPLHPRSTEEQERIEILRLFASARALEDRQQLGQAIETLERARKLSPDSASILRRLSRLNLVLGRVDAAVSAARKLLEIDPGDTASISLITAYYLERKKDPSGAEVTLRKLTSNPNLDKKSAGYLLILRTQGDLCAEALNRPSDAADVYEKLMNALDDKAVNALSAVEKARVTDGDEAALYARFGETFLKADRPALAVRAFRQGLVYKPDHPILTRSLATALLKAKEPVKALAALEPHLKRQPAGSDDYALLIDILEASGKANEAIPRLEAAARIDPKNLRLQFLLAERYRADGQVAKAEALLSELLKNQADPQVYAALADSYSRSKKADELVRLLGEALERPGGIEAIRPSIESVTKDPEMAGRLLDAGLRMMEAVPPTLTPKARQILAIVAGQAKLADKLVAIDRAAIKADPSADNLRQLALDLYFNAQKFDAAAETLSELFAKHPAEKKAATILLFARSLFFSGKVDPAVAAAKDALKVEPGQVDAMAFLAFLLSQVGRDDEAIALYEDMLKRYPNEEEVVKRARSGMSTSYVNKGDVKRGMEELEILYRQHPDDAGVNNDLGYLYAEQGKDLEKAESMIRKALEEEPDNGSYLDSLGWVLFQRGKLQEAIEPLEKAAKSDRIDVTICEHLGDVLFRLKDFARAGEYWRKAEELAAKTSPPAKRIEEIRKKLAELKKLDPESKPKSGDGP